MGAALCTLFRQKPVRVIYFGKSLPAMCSILWRMAVAVAMCGCFDGYRLSEQQVSCWSVELFLISWRIRRYN